MEIDSKLNVIDDENLVLKPEEKIYGIAVDENTINWKSFLYELIYREGLDPWDIDLGFLTKKYLYALKDLREVNFNISGKFLTIAVFLLKIKSEKLLQVDLKGFEEKVEEYEKDESEFENEEIIEDLNEMEENEEILTEKSKNKNYKLRFRNPIARKRKVTIFDLIKTLEKTFQQSNKRRINFLERNVGDVYNGPKFEKKQNDLNQIIEDLFEFLYSEFKSGKKVITFSSILDEEKTKIKTLGKFIPLLYLYNQNRVDLKQEKHFAEIEILKK